MCAGVLLFFSWICTFLELVKSDWFGNLYKMCLMYFSYHGIPKKRITQAAHKVGDLEKQAGAPWRVRIGPMGLGQLNCEIPFPLTKNLYQGWAKYGL